MKALTCLLGLGLVSVVSAQSPLTTIFAGPNGLADGGVVFVNMTVNVTAITVNRLDINTNSAVGTQGRVRLWQTLPGFPFFSGSEGIPQNWQLLGEGWVTAAGLDLPSTVCFQTPITLTSAMGARGYAFEHVGVGPRYTNGTGANQVYNTAELSLNAGASGGGSPYAHIGGQNPFLTGTNNPRVFNGAIHYVNGTSAPVCTFNDRLGRACGDSADTFFDISMTALSAVPSLTGRQVTMVPNGLGGYSVVTAPSAGLIDATAHTPLTGWASTIAGATATDDGEVVVPLSFAFPHPQGSTNSLVVHNNGMVSAASNMAFLDAFVGGGDDWAPSVTALRDLPESAWTSWHDMDITTAGEVRFNDTGTQAVITWVGVPSAFGVVTNTSTFQFTFDIAGTVTIAWETIDAVPLAPLGYSGNPWLVGYSPGGVSPAPESAIDVALTGATDTVATVNVSNSLLLSSTAVAPATRPVFGSVIDYTVGSFPLYNNGTPYAVPFGLLYFSVLNPSAPGFPLAFVGIGRPGCLLNFDFASPIGPFQFTAPGTVLSVDTNVVVPSMLGLDFWGQAVVVDVLGDLLGSLVSSNAVHQRVENN